LAVLLLCALWKQTETGKHFARKKSFAVQRFATLISFQISAHGAELGGMNFIEQEQL